jgi:hypothetical protein
MRVNLPATDQFFSTSLVISRGMDYTLYAHYLKSCDATVVSMLADKNGHESNEATLLGMMEGCVPMEAILDIEEDLSEKLRIVK